MIAGHAGGSVSRSFLARIDANWRTESPARGDLRRLEKPQKHEDPPERRAGVPANRGRSMTGSSILPENQIRRKPLFRGNGVALPEADRSRRVSDRRPMRRKIFGMMAVPLDRNAKAKLLFLARAQMRPTEKGKHYGAVTAKTYAVFAALLMTFHNSGDGRCFPSYQAICEAADCSRALVAPALQTLEECGLLTVCNRLVRVRWKDEAALATRVRVMRTSNCYVFPSEARPAPEPSKAKLQSGTPNQVSNPDLFAALDRLQGALRGREIDRIRA